MSYIIFIEDTQNSLFENHNCLGIHRHHIFYEFNKLRACLKRIQFSIHKTKTQLKIQKYTICNVILFEIGFAQTVIF